jgi:hypothetical protein
VLTDDGTKGKLGVLRNSLAQCRRRKPENKHRVLLCNNGNPTFLSPCSRQSDTDKASGVVGLLPTTTTAPVRAAVHISSPLHVTSLHVLHQHPDACFCSNVAVADLRSLNVLLVSFCTRLRCYLLANT